MRAAIPLGIYTLITAYLIRELVVGLALRGGGALAVIIIMIVLASAMPTYLFLRGRAPRAVQRIIYWVGGLYMAWFLWGLPAALLLDLVRVASWLTGGWLHPSFVPRIVLGILAAMAGAAAYGLVMALRVPRPTRVEITVHDLPRHLDGLTIAQISDLHIGPVHTASRMRRVARAVEAADADLIVLTGDQADGVLHEFELGVSPLAELRAPLGVLAIHGNHDHYTGAARVAETLARVGIATLVNTWQEVAPGLVVAGLDDPIFVGGDGSADDLDATLRGLPDDATIILLAHQPNIFPLAARRGVSLVLSGHTHGGQMWPWGWIVRRFYPYIAGHYHHERSHLYVSRGLGTWGPPLRLGASPELPLFVLRRVAALRRPSVHERAIAQEEAGPPAD